MTTNEIDTTIPAEFIDVATDWYAGSNSMLYAIASTGGLTLGTIRPIGDDGPMNDAQWLHSLFSDLGSELRSIMRSPFFQTISADEIDAISRFHEWADSVESKLEIVAYPDEPIALPAD